MTSAGVVASSAATEVRAIEIAPGVLAAGPADAPAIVFVHGTRLTRMYWMAQLRELGDEFRTVAVDLPGHGALAGTPFTLDGAVAVVAAAIRDHGRGHAILVGLSLGGYVAMATAARYPELVRGLVVSGATLEPAGPVVIGVRALALALDLVERRRFDRLNAWFFRTRYPPEIAEPIVDGGFWSAGGAVALRDIAGVRFAPLLAAYPGPTLLLNGTYDVVMRPGSRRFAGAAQNARRARIGGASHLVNLDQPAAFSAAIRRFARSLPGA
jgi:pimeloyl-ACP methyl ester carboxylesterase